MPKVLFTWYFGTLRTRRKSFRISLYTGKRGRRWTCRRRFELCRPRPGVYLYKNADGEVIYVGKAKNLRSRVRSYLLEASQANAKTGSLMRDAVDVDYILVDNEHEALALENNLIKQRKPRFNILLRDDKTYPYVKLTLGDRYPKVFVTRRLRRDGSAYYGPYFPGNLAYRVVDLIHRSFLLPSCKVDLSRDHPRPCLQYYIGRCLGPCVKDLTTPQIYAEAVRDAQMFLEGRTADLNKSLHERMAAAAAAEQFELAARYRDLLITVDQMQEKQRIASAEDDDADVFGFHFENGMIAVNLFHMRAGKIVDRREFFWEELPEFVAEIPEAESAAASAPREVRRLRAGSLLLCPPEAALHRPAVRAAQYLLAGGLCRSRHAGKSAGRADEASCGDCGPAARGETLAGRSGRAEREAELRSALPRAAAEPEGDPAGAAGCAHAGGSAAHHRMLRHLPYPGGGNRSVDGGLGRRRDEEERLPQVPDQNSRRRG